MLSGKQLLVLVVVTIALLPIGMSFYKYYYSKDYDYLIEAECDPLKEICYSRDCTNPDDCPPNGLSVYKEFYVKAFDFEKCTNNSCHKECVSGLIKCTPIPCGDSDEDVCTNTAK